MREAQLKKFEVRFITFDEFVEFGKKNATNMVGGMPWSFGFYGIPVTHETDEYYLRSRQTGETVHFRRGEILIFAPTGNVFTLPEAEFKKNYDVYDNWDNEKLEFTYKTQCCIRCGKPHDGILARRFMLKEFLAKDGWVYYAYCPVTNEPIEVRRRLNKIETGDTLQISDTQS